MSHMDIDIDHLKTWIGREERAQDRIDARLVASFLAALDRDPADVREGDDAPLCIHWCLAPAIVANSATGADGHPARGGFLPPVPLPRRMWAGGALSFLEPLRIGGDVTRRSTIENVELKDGRSGTLCFVTVRHRIDTARGTAIDERQDLVYRAGETAPPATADLARNQQETSGDRGPAASSRSDRGEMVRRFKTHPLALFRYSALTFNGHRIHYDRPYAIAEEGYRGLVVHGPLQATLLCHLAAEALGRSPTRFEYRGMLPLFDDDGLQLNASPVDDGWRLWSSGDDGVERMKAAAS